MYHYNICTIADEVIFQKQCRALETHLPHLSYFLVFSGEKGTEPLLEDVDGSLMQRYWLDGKMIRVYNSNDIRSVYIDSEVELEPYFKGKNKAETPLAE